MQEDSNRQKTAVITGVNGQDGSYLGELLLSKGYRVIGLKRRTSTISTGRIDHLIAHPNFVLKYYDLQDASFMNHLLMTEEVDEIYNLAAQSHVAVSFEIPDYTTNGICQGTQNILNAIRSISPMTKMYQASSSEMYGDSTDFGPKGYNENSRMMPVSPYAVAKLYAHNMVRVYREAYGIHASCGILFNHESPRRGETFVTRKITMAAARIAKGMQDKLRLGNLDAKRDWGHAMDYVKAMWLMLQQDNPSDYVVATGETYRVEDFLHEVFTHAGLGDWHDYVVVDPRLMRPNEVPYLLGDSSKARKELGWVPEYDMRKLAQVMYNSDLAMISCGSVIY
jgi:GDPmannose 4,6-dehydratase